VAEAVVEKFAPNGGRVTGGIGIAVVVFFLGSWVLDPSGVPLWVPALSLFVGVLIWAAMLRPRLLVVGTDLVLRNMLETIHVPLAAVSEIAVRQVTAVRVGEKRFVCPGAGRTMRQALRGSNVQRMRRGMAGVAGSDDVASVEAGMIYGDFVEDRVRRLVSEDRTRRGVPSYGAEVDALAAQVRREPAWLEIGSLAVTLVLLVLAVLLG
jgi:hypothetical protein